MKSLRLASFSLLSIAFVFSCATAEDPIGGGTTDTRPHVDTGTVGIDTHPSSTDTGSNPRDSSSPPTDTGSGVDTGTIADTGVDPDTGSDPDTFVDFDTGTTPDTTTGGSPCGFCTGTCPTLFSDEGCFLGCVGFGGASGCTYDESVTPACTCIP